MNSETKLVASSEQAKLLALKLQETIKASNDSGEMEYVSIILDQMQDNGPWRLVIGVRPNHWESEDIGDVNLSI